MSETRHDVGIDFGGTLAKVLLRRTGAAAGAGEKGLFPIGDIGALEKLLASCRPVRIGATGAGARSAQEWLARLAPVTIVDEFQASAEGERILLLEAGLAPGDPHLLVSIGTGTSMLKITRDGAARVGGTALGGGTLRGLGELLARESGHEALARLSESGDSRKVDLLVSDFYPAGEIALGTDLTAASFGRLASREPADLAAAVVRLVGENIALLAGALASSHGCADVVYAGATLRGHELFQRVLENATALTGRRALFLPNGEFAGAAGAMAAARRES